MGHVSLPGSSEGFSSIKHYAAGQVSPSAIVLGIMESYSISRTIDIIVPQSEEARCAGEIDECVGHLNKKVSSLRS